MKYCSKCGTQLEDDAVVCVGCGRLVDAQPSDATVQPHQPSTLSTVAFVFMIIGTVVLAMCTCCVALAWCLPMTISYNKKVKSGLPVSTGFKVCALLFVSTIAGVLMLCDNSN